MDPLEPFPSFKPLFESNGTVPRYLTLLRTRQEDAAFAVAHIREAKVRSGVNLDSELSGLLLYNNWRPQIVGAVALLLGATRNQVALLWNAIDKPSWISPQLAATAYHVDPNFCAEALRRIETRGQLDTADASKMEWPERHSALGPGSLVAHTAKVLSALVALVELTDGERSELLSAPDIRQIIASDVDHGGKIAVRWLTDILATLDNPIANNFKQID